MRPRTRTAPKPVRERLAHSHQILENRATANPERTTAILLERARRLAQHKRSAPVADSLVQVLVVRQGRESYGIPLAHLREVCAPGGITSVPGAHFLVSGVINFRGEILPVVDLPHLLQLESNTIGAAAPVVVFQAHGCEIGVRVEHVEGVRQISTDKLATPGEDRLRCVKGATDDGLFLLDIEEALARINSQEINA